MSGKRLSLYLLSDLTSPSVDQRKASANLTGRKMRRRSAASPISLLALGALVALNLSFSVGAQGASPRRPLGPHARRLAVRPRPRAAMACRSVRSQSLVPDRLPNFVDHGSVSLARRARAVCFGVLRSVGETSEPDLAVDCETTKSFARTRVPALLRRGRQLESGTSSGSVVRAIPQKAGAIGADISASAGSGRSGMTQALV